MIQYIVQRITKEGIVVYRSTYMDGNAPEKTFVEWNSGNILLTSYNDARRRAKVFKEFYPEDKFSAIKAAEIALIISTPALNDKVLSELNRKIVKYANKCLRELNKELKQ